LTRPIQSWVAPATIATVGLGLLGYGMGTGRDKVFVAGIAACFVCLLSYVAVSRLMPRYYAARLMIVAYAVQLLALAAMAALSLPLGPQYHPFEINAADAPIRSVLAMLTVPIGAVAAAGVWYFFSRLSKRQETVSDPEDVAARRRVYLIIGALAHLLYWPAGLENSGPIGYLGRVLATVMIMAPFLAGHDSWNDRRLATLWSFTIFVNAAIGIAAGTRSKALIAAVLFVAGYISAVPRRKRIMASVCAAVLAVPLIQLAGALGVVRDELGRGGLEMFESDHIAEVFHQLSREMLPGDSQSTEAVREHGVSRLLAWTNVVVPLMTPETIPYRGFDGFLDEVSQTFRVASVSGLTPEDLYEAGLWTAPARQYGFSVNAFTSVEFTLAADGWTRGGGLVAVLFSFLAALGMTIGELGAERLHWYGAGVATILALPIAKAAFFDTTFIPLLEIFRGMILYMFFGFVVVIAVEFARRTIRSPRRRLGAMPPARWSSRRG
jgi:hypothetical protein